MPIHARRWPLLVAIALAASAMLGCAAFERRSSEADLVVQHVVKPGETLEDVADDYYGNPRRAREIRRFNDLGRFEDVEPGAELDIPMTPTDIETRDRRRRAREPYREGVALAAEGKYLDATIAFRRSIELDPRFAEARYNLGAAYQRMDAHQQALAEFEKAAELREERADYRFAVGGSLFHLERYNRAVTELRRALKIDPFHLQARYSLAAALEKIGKIDDARDEWQRYLELDGTSPWADRARAHLQALDER